MTAASAWAAIIGSALAGAFLIVVYRLVGLVAVVALGAPHAAAGPGEVAVRGWAGAAYGARDALTGDEYEERYGGAAAVPEYVVRVDGDLYLDGRAAADAVLLRQRARGERVQEAEHGHEQHRVEPLDLQRPIINNILIIKY